MAVRNKSPGYRRIHRMLSSPTGKVCAIATPFPQRGETRMRSIEIKRLKILQCIIKEAMPDILHILQEEQADSLPRRNDGLSDLQRRIANRFRVIHEEQERLARVELLEELLACADYTDKILYTEWANAVRATFGVEIRKDLFIGEEYSRMLSEWARWNVGYIKSIENSCLDEIEQVITDSFTLGRTSPTIAKDIQHRFDLSASKANLLARDQIGTLSAQLDRTRHEAAGVKEYIWRTSKDERVRECHKELNGQRFRYDNPPAMWYMTKHGKVYTGRRCNPGEDYNCRCFASPVFEDNYKLANALGTI